MKNIKDNFLLQWCHHKSNIVRLPFYKSGKNNKTYDIKKNVIMLDHCAKLSAIICIWNNSNSNMDKKWDKWIIKNMRTIFFIRIKDETY